MKQSLTYSRSLRRPWKSDKLRFMKPKKESRKPVKPPSKHLLQQLAQTPEKLFANAFRNQYGAICFRRKNGDREVEILVITSRETGRWIVPKGWR